MVQNDIKIKLMEKIDGLPTRSGVYIMYDCDGNIIYIGKAVVLKNRVRQYFQNSQKPPRVEAMVSHIADFEYIITINELDALVLESNLIKKHSPPYNVLLKDDKGAPYIRIDCKKEFPKPEIVRRVREDGAKYFGPYISGVRVGDIMEIIKSAYRLRSCTQFKKGRRACLNKHIELCSAPCENCITAHEYHANVEKVCAFLKGMDDDAEKLIEKRMYEAAESEEFERAMRYRDQLQILKRMKEKIVADTGSVKNMDFFAYVTNGVHSVISVLFVRAGKITGIKNFQIIDIYGSGGEALEIFAAQYYNTYPEIPSAVYFSQEPKNPETIAELFLKKTGKKTETGVPKRGEKAHLMRTALDNAEEYLQKSAGKLVRQEAMTTGAVAELKELLDLKRQPVRIECFDISNIGGSNNVASMSVFVGGSPERKSYRKFKIRGVTGANDFACMKEAISRRLAHIGEEKFGATPDLIIVDGGKGQLSAALEARQESGVHIEIVALAEKKEEIFVPNRSESIFLPRDSHALNMIIRLRDEAHRFAVAYHSKVRGKSYVSELTKINGVGAATARTLLLHFKDINIIKNASPELLATARGVSKRAAAAISEYFRDKEQS